MILRCRYIATDVLQPFFLIMICKPITNLHKVRVAAFVVTLTTEILSHFGYIIKSLTTWIAMKYESLLIVGKYRNIDILIYQPI